MNKDYFAWMFLFGILSLQGWAQDFNGLEGGKSGQAFLPHKLIVKIKDPYRSHCSDTEIRLPFFQALREQGVIQRVQKYFPQAEPAISRQAPVPALNPVDLSLIYEVFLGNREGVPKWVRYFDRQVEVAYAEPEYVYELFHHPNDPYADTTGGIVFAWHLDVLQVREAWDINRGDTSVVIGVVDSGTSFEHEDLKDNLAYNSDDPIDGIDNDGDGYIDNYRGWDFGGDTLNTFGDNDPSFLYSSHGVSVQGISSATPNNGIGVAGMSYDCRYLPIKATRDDPSFPGNVIGGYKGIVYAADQGAQVINCSWGGTTRTQLGEDAVNYATLNRGAGIIAAAGNSGKDEPYYPAAYKRVLSVTNITEGDTLATTFNPTFNYSVGVSAPGTWIYTTLNHEGYGGFSFTSSAAPVATGVVGIVKSHFPQYSGFQATQRVRVTTEDIYDLNPAYLDKLGTGRVNMLTALTAPARPAIQMLSQQLTPLSGFSAPVSGDTLLVQAQFMNTLDPSQQLQLSVTAPGQEEFVEILGGQKSLGVIQTHQIFSLNPPIRIRLSPDIPQDYPLALRFTYTDASSGYEDFEYIEQRVNPTYLDVIENPLATTINTIGNFGFNDFPNNQQGLGFRLGNRANVLFEGGLLIGNAPDQVASNIRSSNGRDQDFRVLSTIERQDDPFASFKSVARIKTPLGAEITQTAYAFPVENPADGGFVIFLYEVHNPTDQLIADIYLGKFADWDIGDFARNASNYDANHQMVFAYEVQDNHAGFYGISLLSDSVFTAFATVNPSDFEYTLEEKFLALSNQPDRETAVAGVNQGGADVMHFIGSGPFDLAPNTQKRIAFALVAGDSFPNLSLAQIAAKEKYRCVILGEGPTAGFTIDQENPATGDLISFTDNNPLASNWYWEFGDGSTSLLRNPNHTYTAPGNYVVKFTVSHAGCELTYQKLLQVDVRSHNSDPIVGTIDTYPNPVQEQLLLKGQQLALPTQFLIYDEMGRRLWEYTPQSAAFQTEIEVGTWASGLYFLHIQQPQRRETRKILIQSRP